jgi:hypothetical protein
MALSPRNQKVQVAGALGGRAAEVAEVVAFRLGPGGGAFSGAPVTMDLGWSAR